MRTFPSLVKLITFMVVTAVAFGTLALTIARIDLGEKAEYTALFHDVTGLNTGDDVRIAGVRVGEVTGIELDKRTVAKVTMQVDAHNPLTRGSRAVIRYRNLVGQRYIALTQGPGSEARLEDGAQIPLDRTQSALDLTVLFNGFKPLFAALSPQDVNQLSAEIIKTLQGEGGTINSLLAKTASLTSTLADRDAVIGRTITNLNTVLGTVASRDEQLDQLLVQLQRFVSGLAQDRQAIGASLTHINSLADETAGLLVQARPPIQGDVAQLRGLAARLNTKQNTTTFETFMDSWPGKLSTITRTATYGSWFNFYLCGFDGTVTLPTGPQKVPAKPVDVNTARCR